MPEQAGKCLGLRHTDHELPQANRETHDVSALSRREVDCHNSAA